MLPLREHVDCIDLAMADPCDSVAEQGISFLYGRPVRKFAALETDIDDGLTLLENAASTKAVVLPVTFSFHCIALKFI